MEHKVINPPLLYVFLRRTCKEEVLTTVSHLFKCGGHLGNQLGSLQSGQYQTASVTFYDGNFTGRSLTFNDITINKTYSERDYFSSFDFNDLTSSIEVIYF